jgi:hypothetical protein
VCVRSKETKDRKLLHAKGLERESFRLLADVKLS